jgi:glycosyltransferase involved in cell wall biosynthesis
MKLISIVTPCYNEEENVEDLHAQILQIMSEMPGYEFEHIYIDNASTDGTVPILRRLAAKDSRVKVILNARNFGHIRSPFHGILQAHGDAVICMSSDFQDPPAWSKETRLLFMLRKLYYRVLAKLSDVRLVENFTGFALYDQQVIRILRQIDDPYPYIRGLIAEIGFEAAKVEFLQPKRRRGITKNNLYTLYDMAMLGFTSNTKIPLRLATMVGFLTAAVSFLTGLFYFVYKLIYWHSFSTGLAPLVVGLFFVGGVQLFFLGIVGEYIGAIYTQVRHRPLVIEKERINFDSQDH